MTRSDFEKKRWPPRSMRLPACTIVRARPPISPEPSTTIGRIRVRSSSSNAAVRPAGPAPMTTAVPLLYDIRDRVDHTEKCTRTREWSREWRKISDR